MQSHMISKKSKKLLLEHLHLFLHRSIKNSIKNILTFGFLGGSVGLTGSKAIEEITTSEENSKLINLQNQNSTELFSKENQKHGLYGTIAGLFSGSLNEFVIYIGTNKTSLRERKQIFKKFLPRLKFTPPTNKTQKRKFSKS